MKAERNKAEIEYREKECKYKEEKNKYKKANSKYKQKYDEYLQKYDNSEYDKKVYIELDEYKQKYDEYQEIDNKCKKLYTECEEEKNRYDKAYIEYTEITDTYFKMVITKLREKKEITTTTISDSYNISSSLTNISGATKDITEAIDKQQPAFQQGFGNN